jgi:microcystin-dependent protein
VSQPYVGEIRMFAGSFAPAGWMLCQGQLLPISENEVLFNLIGTTYGGDGQETFALPDLQGRMPVHAGTGPGISQTYQLGEKDGVESVTLSVQQIPIHTHTWLGSADIATDALPTNDVIGASSIVKPWGQQAPDGTLAANTIQPIGGSQPHENMMPFLCINFIISLFGIFPTQN